MKNLYWISAIAILFSVLLTACQKSEDSDKKKEIVWDVLSEDEKALLDHFYDNPTITYSDEENQELLYKTDSLSPRAYGGLGMRYYCMTEDTPIFSFLIALRPLNTLWLVIEFGDPVVLSDYYTAFKIFPMINTKVDTTFENGFIVKYDYYDSLTLRSEKFYNVFHLNYPEQSPMFSLVVDCYYSHELGVIAFTTTSDEKFWIRKTSPVLKQLNTKKCKNEQIPNP